MYLHIGENINISNAKIIAILNIDTLELSDVNEYILDEVEDKDKTIVVDENNDIIGSKVSPYTIIKRTTLDEKDILWSKINE